MKILSKKRQHNYITKSTKNQEKSFDKERQTMTKLIKKGQRKKPLVGLFFYDRHNSGNRGQNVCDKAENFRQFFYFFHFCPLLWTFGARSLLSEVCDQPLQFWAIALDTTLIIQYYYYFVKF